MQRSVFVVEDDRSHRRIYSAVLKAHEFRPVEIVDPRTTLASVLKARPIALLIDILLPKMDGRTLIAQLRHDSRTTDIPILAVSAAADAEMADTCLALGANIFRAKPLPLLRLIDDIRAITGVA